MAAWPATLPQAFFVGVSETKNNNLLRTKMDSGPDKVRRRFTAVGKKVVTPIILTGTEKQIFDTFFETTIKDGSLSFAWKDPTDDSTKNFRITKPPKFVCVKPGTIETREWRATLAMEILP